MTPTPDTAPGAGEDARALASYRDLGLDAATAGRASVAALVTTGSRVLRRTEVPGVTIDVRPRPEGLDVTVDVAAGTRVDQPVHLCFGLLDPTGRLDVTTAVHAGTRSAVRFVACCSFPTAVGVRHRMDAAIHLDEGATVDYAELHFHGPHGGAEVVTRTDVTVADDGRFVSCFSLVHGRAGLLDLGYDVRVAARGVADLTTKAFGRADDRIRVEEVLHLDGAGARGVLKSRVAVRDRATSEVATTAEGNAPDCRGHMDCAEIVRGHATASNVPHVVVRDERARITHEAAIGTVNRTELETLMARGLDEDDAVDVIVRGMLR